MPKWFEKIEDVADTDYPLFLKPDDGQGAKGVCLVSNRTELLNVLNSIKILLFVKIYREMSLLLIVLRIVLENYYT